MFNAKRKKLLERFLILSLFCSSGAVWAQQGTVTLNLNNVTVKEALEQLNTQTSYSLWLNVGDVDLSRRISLNVTNGSVNDVLAKILAGQPLSYEVKDRTINIYPAKKDGEEAKKRVEGVVLDDLGEPLPGVAVRCKEHPDAMCATDMDGKFTLNVPTDGKTLQFTFIGMAPQELAVADAPMKVVMSDKEKKLDEVVVTGYQKIDRKLFTGAASRISGEEAKVDGVGDVSQMLQGKAAGVGVQSVSGTFGAAPKIRVRGASSIYGNQTPLWVVDGVVLEDVVEISADDLSSGNAATLISSAVAGLNPDDIDNFQILKDASATALYGARAMNGVIVVNTKKGKNGHASISYTGEFTVRTRPSYRQYNIMNSKDQMSVLMELEDKGWFNHSKMARTENGGVFYLMNDLIYRGELMNTESARLAYLQKAEMRNTNWFKELFRPTIQSNNSVSISSGTDRSRYYVSMSFLDDPGWSVSDKVRRYTANVNASYDISKWLTFGVSVNGSVRNQRAPGTLDRTADPVSGEYSRDFDINPFSYALNTSRTMSPDETYIMNYAPFNILNEARNNYIDLDMTDMKYQMELTYKPVKGLDLSAIGAFRYVKSTQEHKITGNSNLAQAYRAAGDATIREKNKFLSRDPDNPDAVPEVVMPKGGFYNTTNNILKSYYFRVSGNYNRLIANEHPFNIMAGSEVKSADRQSGFNNGYGFQWDRGGTPFVDYRIIQQLLLGGDNYYGLSQYYDRFVAFFATGSFSYKGRYTFNLTGRMDGSNRLGRSRDARWLPTWNVSGSWNMLEEEFMKHQDVVSTLSLRATYGLTATMGPADNALAVFRNSTTYRGDDGYKESQIYIESLQNKDLTWEKQYEFNFGFDFGVLRNRISLSSDIYSRRGFDLIGLIRTSGMGGQKWKYANYADMKSWGVEFTLNTKNIQRKDFSWTSNLTFAYNHNEITNLESTSSIFDLMVAEGAPLEGYPVRGLFSLQYKGLNGQGIPQFINEKGEQTSTGINFQSTDPTYLKYEGSVDPTVTGGFDNQFKYKAWTLGLYFTFQAGNKLRLDPDFSASYGDYSAMPKDLKNRWMKPGDERYTNIPAIPSSYQYANIENLDVAYNAYNYSDIRVANGGFLRLKELTLSYDFNGEWMKAIGMNRLQLRLVASNLWLIYADKKLNGQDPEFFQSGGVSMPLPRQLTLSIRTSF